MLKLPKIPKYLNLSKNLLLKKSVPISLIIFLTNRCNARCDFCLLILMMVNKIKNELSLKIIKISN